MQFLSNCRYGSLFTLDRQASLRNSLIESLKYRLFSAEMEEIASLKWNGAINYHRLIVAEYRGRGISDSLIKLGEELLYISGVKCLGYRADRVENICWGIAHDYYPEDQATYDLVHEALERARSDKAHQYGSVKFKCILLKTSA